MGVKELLRTNDAALLSFVDALLSGSGIPHTLADGHMSVLEGSLGVLPRRVLIDEDDWSEAVELLKGAGLEANIVYER
jgi:hypothetical protein